MGGLWPAGGAGRGKVGEDKPQGPGIGARLSATTVGRDSGTPGLWAQLTQWPQPSLPPRAGSSGSPATYGPCMLSHRMGLSWRPGELLIEAQNPGLGLGVPCPLRIQKLECHISRSCPGIAGGCGDPRAGWCHEWALVSIEGSVCRGGGPSSTTSAH